jgi:hypothetical protein
MKYLFLILILLSCSSKSYRDASRESANLSPKPWTLKEDIFQIYYARAFSWRGYFGVHPWVTWKKTNEEHYTVSQVTAWNLRHSSSTIQTRTDIPDRLWFDSQPTLLFEARGQKAAIIIEKVKSLIKKYPMQDRYQVYPGPNSNTYVSYLIRNIPEIKVSLPPHAIGKDFYYTPLSFTPTASATGYQFSLYGLFGLSLGLEEGVEVNLGGLNFGVDFWPPALKLPIVGRLGFPDQSFTQ